MSPVSLRVIDSHTGGEPTRIVVSGVPDLGTGTLAERSKIFRENHDWLRGAVCDEPRGHEAIVGGLLVKPHAPDCVAGVIFFNNVSTLHMCIHGTIGLVATLAHMGKISSGTHRIDTPVGVVEATLREDGGVEVANVPSWRHRADVAVNVPNWGVIKGDIAWGGNWFFLINGYGPQVSFCQLEMLTNFSRTVRKALADQGITGENGMEIDHIEVFGPPADPAKADSKNFVLCPGNAYDRSPCGTGTSAKLACLHASGKLKPGEVWRQASILDTVFTGTVEEISPGKVRPRISGRAWVNGEATYILHPEDPFRYGISNPA